MRYSTAFKLGDKMGAYQQNRIREDIAKTVREGHLYGVPFKKGKRFRSAFTTEQVHYLEKEFRGHPYISNSRRKEVANILEIPERAVKIWFQNRRMKQKKDASNKDPDVDKSMEVNEQLNNLCALQSVNDASLPMITITSPVSLDINLNSSNELKYKKNNLGYQNHFKDLSLSQHKKENLNTITENHLHSSKSAAEILKSSQKHKTVNDYYGDENKLLTKSGCLNDKLTAHMDEEQKQTPPTSRQHFNNQNDLDYSPYIQPPAVPQDLSSKSIKSSHKARIEEKNPELKFNPSEIPFYLNGFHIPPYIPPGSMIWKPVSMAPLVASASVTFSSESTVPHNNIMNRSCICDCHKPPPPIMLQNPSNANLQYIITAVPFQNSSPKF